VKRWISSLILVALGASLPLAVDAARAAVAPLKPKKIDLSRLTLSRAPDAATTARPPTPPTPSPTPPVELTAVELQALRARVAQLLGVQPAQVPTFQKAPALSNPGDTITLSLDTPMPPDTGIQFANGQSMMDGSVHSSHWALYETDPGSASVRIPALANRTYLFNCFVETTEIELTAYFWETVRGGWFTTKATIANGKAYAIHANGPSRGYLTLSFTSSDLSPGGRVKFSRCDVTLVQ
jgi:hypothetical protein